jgi:hypothetical protein
MQAYLLECGHVRIAQADALFTRSPLELYCGICRDNKQVLDRLNSDAEVTIQFPSEVSKFQIKRQQNEVVLVVGDNFPVLLYEPTITLLVKDWELQKTVPGDLFPFYKALQMHFITEKRLYRVSIPTSLKQLRRKLPKSYLMHLSRMSIDKYLSTGEARFLTSAVGPLAVLFSSISKGGEHNGN